MITLRPSRERGTFDFGWLRTSHSFSFGEYRDPAHMRFSALRVINEDVVAPGAGFPEHPHRDMEIITILLAGALRHKDSSGGGGVIRPGDVQRMSAGSGVYHSEFNDSDEEPAHLLQVWIMPNVHAATPRYGQIHLSPEDRLNRLAVAASPDGGEGSLAINQDARLFVTTIEPGRTVEHALGAGRKAWVQVAKGALTLNGQRLDAGDGAAVEGESALALAGAGSENAEALLFDLP